MLVAAVAVLGPSRLDGAPVLLKPWTLNTSPKYVAVATRLGLAAENVNWLMVQHVRFVRS